MLLGRPPDRFETAGLMSQLFSLERAELWQDAADRCDFFALRYSKYPWSAVLRLRALAYRGRVEGHDAVRTEYKALAQSSFAPVARQAQDLLWVSESDERALLGMHMRGRYTVWIDGIKVASGSSKARLDVRRLTLAPGEHSWEVEFEPTTQGSMISMCLRTQWGDVTSEGDWDIVSAEPIPGREIPDSFKGGSVLPNMTVWQFEPNSYINMQSGFQTIPIWSFWDSKPRVGRVRLRQSWTSGPGMNVVAVPDVVPERSAEEKRAHAID